MNRWAIPCILIASSASADILPSLDNFNFVNDPKYAAAANAAQRATLIQVGFSDKYKELDHYVATETGLIQKEATQIMNEYLPLKAETLFVLGGMAWTLKNKKEISRSFRSPFLSNTTHVIAVGQESCYTGIQIKF